MHRIDRVGHAWQYRVGDRLIGASHVDVLPPLRERRLDVRPHQRNLGFGDSADSLPHRAHQLQHLFLGDERREQPEQAEHLDVLRTEPPFERAGIGETGAPPKRQRDVGIDLGAGCGLREREAVASGPERAKRSEAQQATLFVGLHELRDRCPDLVE